VGKEKFRVGNSGKEEIILGKYLFFRHADLITTFKTPEFFLNLC